MRDGPHRRSKCVSGYGCMCLLASAVTKLFEKIHTVVMVGTLPLYAVRDGLFGSMRVIRYLELEPEVTSTFLDMEVKYFGQKR